MNAYEQKQANRRERMEALAERMQAASDAAYQQSRRMAEVIPFGQPILVGHHSEKRDRNYRARIWRTQDRCLELQRKAEYFRRKASGVGEGGISSDDPDGAEKLREQLVPLEAMQARMKAVNAAHKRFLKDAGSLDKAALSDADKALIRSYKPAYSWEPHPIAPYKMTNNNANIRRIKERIALLGQQAERAEQDDKEHDCGAYRVIEAFSENRVQVVFDGKPADSIRAALKSNGFRWSPTAGAWQRHYHQSIAQGLIEPDGYLRKQLGA